MTWRDNVIRLKDAKGLHYVAYLLANPGRQVWPANSPRLEQRSASGVAAHSGGCSVNVKPAQLALTGEGWRLVSGGTDNHLMLVDVFAKGITGKVAEKALDKAGITANKNTIPFDTNSPMVASGIRLGTPALTTRGMKEAEMDEVGKLVSRALHAVDDEAELADVKREVRKLCDRFPLYAQRLASYEKALAKA